MSSQINRTEDGLDLSSLEPIELRLQIMGKAYLLKEATAGAATKYRNLITQAVKIGPEGKPVGMGDIHDADLLLLSMCLYEGDKLVLIQVIRGWPDRVVSRLVTKCKQISGLESKDTREALQTRLDSTIKALRDFDENAIKEDSAPNLPAPMTPSSGSVGS